MPIPGLRIDYRAEPTLAKFHLSDAFIRGVRGPVGSGKSVAVGPIELLRRACQQYPDSLRRRRTRFAVLRNTYGELRTTTIKTWLDWIPEGVCKMKWDEPITCTLKSKLPDGTLLDMEVFFIACDRPGQIGKLKSLELTGAWLNEASEFDKSVLDMVTARVGRFPPKRDGVGIAWCGVVMDTNSMDDDHWYHDLDCGPTDVDRRAEYETMIAGLKAAMRELGVARPLMEFFTQPPALLEVQGSLVPNPEAENVRNQQLGAAYWLQVAAGKSKEWIDLYILNRYGKVIDGKPVYVEYNEEIHGKPVTLRPLPGIPITVGLDYGLSPAAVAMQQSPKGQLLVLGELVSEERSMGFLQFCEQALKPWLANRFGPVDPAGNSWQFRFVGDPTGARRSESDEKSALQIGIEAGLNIYGAKTNAFPMRRESLAFFMNRLVQGEPAIRIDQSCRMLKKALRGGYHYRRVQVLGENRYQDVPFKNKYSHVVEAAQYAAMEYVAIEAPAAGMNMVPEWKRRLMSRMGASDKPWKVRGGHVGFGRRAH